MAANSLTSYCGPLLVALTLVATGCAADHSAAAAAADRQLQSAENTEKTGQKSDLTGAEDGVYAPPGNRDKGWFYKLAYTNVSMSPDARFLVANVPVPGPNAGFDAPGLALAVHDLQTGTTELFAELRNVKSVIFASQTHQAFALSETMKTVAVIDLVDLAIDAELHLGAPHDHIALTPDDQYLLASNHPTTDAARVVTLQSAAGCKALDGRDQCRVTSVALATNKVSTVQLPHRIVDIDVLADGETLALTWNESDPKSDPKAPKWRGRIRTMPVTLSQDPQRDGLQPMIQLPGCASGLHIANGAKRAVVSSVGCLQGQVHVLSWPGGKLLASEGGHGPVTLSPGGAAAVFATKTSRLQNKGKVATQNAVVAVDLQMHTFIAHGWDNHPELPRLAIDAGGKVIYAQGHKEDGAAQISMLKVGKQGPKAVIGGATHLDAVAWSADGSLLYVLSNGALYRIADGMPVAAHVAVPGSPELLGLGAGGHKVVLAEKDAPQFYLVDVLAGDKVQSLHLVAK